MKAGLLKKQHEAIFLLDAGPVEDRKRAFAVACAVSGDGMSASIKVQAAVKECGVSEFDILCALFNKGVRTGIIYDEIEDVVNRKRFNEEIIVAAGQPPENGKDAELVPQLELKEFGAAEVSAGAKAGVPVELDRVIMIKQPATQGVHGWTVLGRKLPPAPGADKAFERGEHVAVSRDGLKLLAEIPGLAGLSNGRPCVREDTHSGWKFKVQLRKDNMEAVLSIVPDSGVQQPDITEDLIRRLLASEKVVFGVEPDIKQSIPPKISVTTTLKVASGKPPIPDKNASLTEHFRRGAEKSQNLFWVKKGQLLVEKTPVRPGDDGKDVLGAAVPPQKGKDVELKPGANTKLSDDRLTLFAEMDGFVSKLDDEYCVVECMELDSSRKPIPQKVNYDGMVKISGNVNKGQVITAGHHVIVQGNINCAEIVAGGFLQVQGDIKDCSDTKIQSASDMYLSSASRAKIRSGGNIYFSGKARDCEIVSSGGIYNTEGGDFSLVGGRVVAARSVEAEEIGDQDRTKTIIEAGLPLSLRVRYEQSIRELEEISKKSAVIGKELKRLLTLSKTTKTSPAEFDKIRKLAHLYKMVAEKITQLKAGVDSLLASINTSHTGSSVSVKKSLHPGTMLKVGIHSRNIEEDPGAILFKANKDNTALTSRKLQTKLKKEMTIMFTDIVGYSTYTSIHGDMAASTMLDNHNELLFPLVSENKGRIIKTIGDSIMAVFYQPHDAVQCGMDMQRALDGHNEDEPDEHKIKIRIGINTGDGIEEGGDVFGDVVNMAARVESLTNGDEVRISISTYSAVFDKVDAEFRSLGLRKLKGKEELIEVFDVIWQ